jgi:signal transduction histidine kinase/CheY-like chemotaxis protein
MPLPADVGPDSHRRLRTAALQMAKAIGAHRRQVEVGQTEAHTEKAIAQLTSGVAHDFNNLLTVLLANVELLRHHAGMPQDLHAMLDDMHRAIEHGSGLSRQLLAFARRHPLQASSRDASAVLREVVRLLTSTLGERWPLQVDAPADLWPAHVDQPLLESALLNLALNARDALPGGGTITLAARNRTLGWDEARRLGRQVAAGEYVVITVTDGGAGIAPDVLARVTDPFFTTKPQGMGTGLGLSMVKGFATQAGGALVITSAPGEGTTVTLLLPRGSDVPVTAAAPEPPPQAAVEAVLVVDDNEAVRRLASQLLESLGYRVIAATTAVDALRFLDEGAHVDLLFTDVVMPGPLDGPTLTHEARRRRPGLRVLYTSGHPSQLMNAAGELPPGAHMLAKPFTRDVLARAVRLALTDPAD